MKFNLVLRETRYEEVPEGLAPRSDSADALGVVRISDDFCSYERRGHFFLGADGQLLIKNTDLLLGVEGNQLTVPEQTTECCYWNQRRLQQTSLRIVRGDTLLLAGVKIVFYPDHIRVYGDESAYTCTLAPVEKKRLPYQGFPDYKRSPRIVKRPAALKIEVKAPPAKAQGRKGGLAMTVLPPLATSFVTVGVGMMMGRGSYLLMSVAATAVTITISVIRFFSDRKELRQTDEKNQEMYEAYLLKKRREIYQTYQRETDSYAYNYPAAQQLNQMVHRYDSRIYERMATDQDFLVFSVGRQYGPTAFEIKIPEEDFTSQEDEQYQEAAALKKEYGMIWKEVLVDLKRAHLGLVGDKNIIHQQLQHYLCQLATFHSYRDLQLIVLYDEKYLGHFDWMKWLPHCQLQMLNVRGLIHSEKARDQVLNSMNQLLKERSQKIEESKKEARFKPHFLFVIDEPKLIMDHSIMEYLNGAGDQLGFSIIYTSYLRANLPEYIGTVLLLEHGKEGTLLLKEKEFCNEAILLPLQAKINLELFARDLGVLNHVLGTTSHIPESITFFELYQVQHPQELEVSQRWRTHFADQSLAVPLGVRAVDDIVDLNLHEKAHGPHGLVAGTTGSGKSEIIQSYILSLAVNFHPHEVGFLLIDYKGGGMAGLFKQLPHLLGTITNLDGSESMRALASIKSELARRQLLFGQANVNHINGYMELFREGKVDEPIPHLFLISDEFAELKKEQPDFMKELVSTARIGRSLGVHLILATQKPSGVVDDQIWTNSKFKLALKVQNEGDSKEILKTPDAASITQAGRAYLQVGNNEIYELFQSAWSGAIYSEEQEQGVTLDERVYLVNDLGQRMLVNQDLGGSKAEKAARATQLDATIEHLYDVYESLQPIAVKKPWLPALGTVIVSPAGADDMAVSTPAVTDVAVRVPIGVVDVPEEQKQEEYLLDLTEHGNLMYIASSGFGKSVLLTTIALGLSRSYRVAQVNLFLLDFGSNALIMLRRLPHTAEYMTLDDTERYGKWKRMLTQEMKRRKKQMAEMLAQNFVVYNQTAPEPLRAWVVLVDNFDAIKEMGFEEEEFFTKVTRDGVSLGIYFIITASRTNAIRGATFNSFKNKIGGFNFEKSELMNLVGRSPYTLPEVRGRALVKYGERISCMQIYSMTDFTNDLEYREGIQRLIEQIRQEHPGEEAPHMPVMPEELGLAQMASFDCSGHDLWLGLETEEVSVEGLALRQSPLLILGAPGSGKTNLLQVLLSQLPADAKVAIFDSPNRDLKSYERKEGIQLIKTMDQFVGYMNELEQEVLVREKTLAGQDLELDPSALAGTIPYLMIIDDLSVFYSRQTTSEGEIAEMFVRAAAVGILIIATNPISKFYGTDPVTEFFRRSPYGVLVSPQGHLNVAPVSLIPEPQEGVFYQKSRSVKIRIPKA